MNVYEEAPTVLVYWRGQGTADAVDEAIAGHVAKDSTVKKTGTILCLGGRHGHRGR